MRVVASTRVCAMRLSSRSRPSDRKLLVDRLGWTPLSGPAVRLEAGGRAYLARRLASREGRVAVRCEAVGGAPIPALAERRRLRAVLDAHYGEHLAIYTDAAHTESVWSWREPVTWCARLSREHTRGAGAPDERLIAALAAGTRVEPEGEGPGARGARGAVLGALARRLWKHLMPQVLHPECAEPGRMLLRLLEEAESEAAVRAAWRALTRLRVLDPRCAGGEWLRTVVAALEPVGVACLERMESLLEDARRAALPHRPEWMRDMKAVLHAADAPRWGSRRGYVRQVVATLTLYGADPDVDGVGVAVATLAAYAGGPGLPAAPLNLRAGAPGSGVRKHAEAVARLGGGAAAELRARMLAERAAAAHRAAAHARTAWLEGAGVSVTRRDAALVRARLDALGAELDDPALRGARIHPLVEYHPLVQRGGFDVVREVGG